MTFPLLSYKIVMVLMKSYSKKWGVIHFKFQSSFFLRIFILKKGKTVNTETVLHWNKILFRLSKLKFCSEIFHFKFCWCWYFVFFPDPRLLLLFCLIYVFYLIKSYLSTRSIQKLIYSSRVEAPHSTSVHLRLSLNLPFYFHSRSDLSTQQLQNCISESIHNGSESPKGTSLIWCLEEGCWGLQWLLWQRCVVVAGGVT